MLYLFSSAPKTLEEYFASSGQAYQLVTTSDFKDFAETYVANEGDLGIVYDFGKFVPEALLSRLLMLNIHFSLLPKYRGATPVEAAILAGEAETGITIQKMVKAMDAGDILLQEKVAIDSSWTAGELQGHMDSLLPDLLQETFAVPRKNWSFSGQLGEPTLCYESLLNRENAQIKLELESASTVLRKIKAFNPEPLAWTDILRNNQQTTMNILRAESYSDEILQPKELRFIRKRGLAVGTKEGSILITHLVIAGSKPLLNGDIVALKGTLELV